MRFNLNEMVLLLVDEIFGGRDKLFAFSEFIEAKNEEIHDNIMSKRNHILRSLSKIIPENNLKLVKKIEQGNTYGDEKREELLDSIFCWFIDELSKSNPFITVHPSLNSSNNHYYVEICSKNFRLMCILGRNTRKSKYFQQIAEECNTKHTPEQPLLANLDFADIHTIGQKLVEDKRTFVTVNMLPSVGGLHLVFDFPHAKYTKLSDSLGKLTLTTLLAMYDKMKSEKPIPPAPKPKRPSSKKKYGGE